MSVVKWLGDELLGKIEQATLEAIDETTAAAADRARSSHWWSSRTGDLEAEIVNEPATAQGTILSGRFGTTSGKGFYGLFLERRSPFLRPAADQEFTTLAERIAARLD